MLEKIGLLPTFSNQQVPFAYEMYTDGDGPGWRQSSKFKHKLGNEVGAEFMGLWCAFFFFFCLMFSHIRALSSYNYLNVFSSGIESTLLGEH